jgi:Raf kinase inhibitor-like YbhB/YbcL family protein
MRVRRILPVAVIVASLGCGASPPPNTIRLTTPAFSAGSDIPVTYTCRTDNQSPPFAWDNLPTKAQSLVFLVEDLTTRATNWLVYDIDPTSTGSPEAGVAKGGVQGVNWKGKDYYIGPCGPAGAIQRYTFRVIALDTKLALPAGATRAQVEKAMRGHMLAQGEVQVTDAGY